MKPPKEPVFSTIRRLAPHAPDWPPALRSLRRPVHELELAGALPELDAAVAIVGTRFCDPWAFDFARGLARDLARAGRVVVSGGATGIDTAAHQGALDVPGGRTVAVLPSGLSSPYPSANRALFAEVAHRGCVLSELRPEAVRNRSAFLERNRIIAALAAVVVVVQAPERSGSLSTAAHARTLQRRLFAVPSAPWDARGAGCLALIAGGADICRSAADVLSLPAPRGGNSLPPGPPEPGSAPKKASEYQWVDADQRAVWEALAAGPLGADDLCERTVLEAPRIQSALLMLLLSKVIHEEGSGRYARTETS